MLALTVRSGDVRPPPIVEIMARPQTIVIAPRPLTEAGVERIVRAESGAETARLAAACHRLTSGNPILLHRRASRPTPDEIQLAQMRRLVGQPTPRLRAERARWAKALAALAKGPRTWSADCQLSQRIDVASER